MYGDLLHRGMALRRHEYARSMRAMPITKLARHLGSRHPARKRQHERANISAECGSLLLLYGIIIWRAAMTFWHAQTHIIVR